jgi:hypothetical protein
MGRAGDFKSSVEWAKSVLGQQEVKKSITANGANGKASHAEYRPATKRPTLEQLAHKRLGRPVSVATYYFADDTIAEVRARYETADGKEVVPWTLIGARWEPKQMPGPRPLYRLRTLLKEPHKPVLFVEGEGKKAAHAVELFPDYAVTSGSGGCKAAAGMDYTPLRGRRIVVWPDNDAPGRSYAEDVCRLSLAAGAREARIVDVPRDWPRAWDLGDEPPSDAVDLREMLDEAVPYRLLEQDGNYLIAPKLNGALDTGVENVIPFSTLGAAAVVQPTPAQKQANEPPKLIVPTPFDPWRDPKTIPPRKFIYGGHYIRKYISATLAPGAAGKTSLGIVELLAICTGRPLLGIKPVERCNVWAWNGEDPADELERKIHAAMIYYKIPPEEVAGRLYFDSGRDQKIVIAEQTKNGEATICRPVQKHLIQMLQEREIGVFSVDPFLRSHRVKENDNTAMDEAATAWAEVANEADVSIALYQHTRKTNGDEVTVDDSRGAVALPNAARDVRTVNTMTKPQAEEAGIEVEQRRRYFRVTKGGKSNLVEPTERIDWHRFVSVELGNGDSVGVIEPWSPPGLFSDVACDDLPQVQRRIADGEWRKSEKAANWAGVAVAEVLGYDLKSDEARKQIRKMLAVWIGSNALQIVKRRDEKRMEREWVEVGERL